MSKLKSMFRPGQVIANRFEILDFLGRGGSGEVYKAHQINVSREVALKVLGPQYREDREAIELFAQEAKVVSRLRHPNTVTIYEFDQTQEGIFYIAMEYVEGRTLKDELKDKLHFSGKRTVNILKQILKSLAEAHNLGIVHRDIKPANVMLCAVEGNPDWVKVLDFGVAALRKDAPIDLRGVSKGSGEIVGTPQYMSPEQFKGKGPTPAFDIYSVGILGYEMLTGFPPFSGERFEEIMIKHLFDPLPPWPEFTAFDPVLQGIIEKSLKKSPEERYGSAQEMLKALEKWRPAKVGIERPHRISLLSLSVTPQYEEESGLRLSLNSESGGVEEEEEEGGEVLREEMPLSEEPALRTSPSQSSMVQSSSQKSIDTGELSSMKSGAMSMERRKKDLWLAGIFGFVLALILGLLIKVFLR